MTRSLPVSMLPYHHPPATIGAASDMKSIIPILIAQIVEEQL